MEECWEGEEAVPEPAGGIPGLYVGRGFLGRAEQEELLAEARSLCGACEAAPPGFVEIDPSRPNQAMRFGLPPWARDLSLIVREFLAHGGVLPREDLPDFNQMIVNSYAPGQGISPHIDLAAFGDVVVSVSLESAAVMDFSPQSGGRSKVGVLLEPGDLLVLSGEARWEWKHSILRCPEPRTSISLRTLGKGGPHELTEPG